jgi:hypothetical protein
MKPAGVALPPKEILENCISSNDDGAGWMTVHKGKVQIRKGFFKLRSLLKSISGFQKHHGVDLKDMPVAIHFRYATHGKTNVSNCHPFPLCSDENFLGQPNVECEVGIAHNGIISRVERNAEWSDTFLFIRDYIGGLKNIDELKRMKKLIDVALCGDRFLALGSNGEFVQWGKWHEGDKDDKCQYSSTSFRYKKVTYASGYHGYGAEDWTGGGRWNENMEWDYVQQKYVPKKGTSESSSKNLPVLLSNTSTIITADYREKAKCAICSYYSTMCKVIEAVDKSRSYICIGCARKLSSRCSECGTSLEALPGKSRHVAFDHKKYCIKCFQSKAVEIYGHGVAIQGQVRVWDMATGKLLTPPANSSNAVSIH